MTEVKKQANEFKVLKAVSLWLEKLTPAEAARVIEFFKNKYAGSHS